jgi:hypothetical protein
VPVPKLIRDDQCDYEGELSIVISKTGKSIKKPWFMWQAMFPHGRASASHRRAVASANPGHVTLSVVRIALLLAEQDTEIAITVSDYCYRITYSTRASHRLASHERASHWHIIKRPLANSTNPVRKFPFQVSPFIPTTANVYKTMRVSK